MSRPPHIFSKRTAWDLGASEFSQAISAAKVAGTDLVDLTVSNPTVCGFQYDPAAILGPLSDEEIIKDALIYDPDPRGLRSAREAVAHYYADHGAEADPDAFVLTTSTSEAYSFLFRLLCNAGDEVLIAQPGYPLFDYLASLDDVKLATYPLFYDFGWWIDFAELERKISHRTRSILVVHPNNPTGHWTHRAERERLEDICARHGLALIVDEVFLDYPIDGSPGESFALGPHPVLTFVLSGISKIAALPQMKVAWIASFGPADALKEALGRLEVISDTFLSLGAPAQLALPRWLAGRGGLQRQIALRTNLNLDALEKSGLAVLRIEAGWSTIARLTTPILEGNQTPVNILLHEAGVIVHPGRFYGFADRRIIVVSLLTPCEMLGAAIQRMRGIIGVGRTEADGS